MSAPAQVRSVALAIVLALGGVLAFVAAGIGDDAPRASATDPVVWAVGDGGVRETHDDRLAEMIARRTIDRFLYLGDVYETGTREEFATNYHGAFGRFKSITHPTPGNHEWRRRAEGYDPYWGARAPQQPGGGHYYSFDFAGWHFVSLNSEEEISPQVDWLRRDLAAYSGSCTIAFIHQPRYSGGNHGDAPAIEPLWAQLAGHAVAFLAGHDHNYQRLRPERGIVQFVVGTGGRHRSAVDRDYPRLVAADDDNFGALRIELAPARAEFEFVATGGSVLDSGSLGCRQHGSVVRISHPREGRSYSRALSAFRGTFEPAGGSVTIGLRRRTRSGCRSFDGRRFVASCRAPALAAGEGPAWRYAPGRRLPRGAYTLSARAGSSSHDVRFRIR